MLVPVLLAVAAATMYAATNHIDKYLISRKVKNVDYKALILVSTLLAGIAMSVIYFFICNFQFAFDWQSVLVLFGASAIYAVALIFYFKSLENDDTTIVAIMFQLIPVFMLLLSPLFLGDQSISLIQLIGGLVVTLAAIFVTYEPDRKKFSKKRLKTLAMMTIVSLAFAAWFIAERYVNQNHDFNQTTMWSSITLFVVGLLIIVFLKSYRKSFGKMLKSNGPQVIGLNIANEFLNSFGGVVSNLAGTMASVALVSFITQGVQPFAVMLIGIIIAKLFPKLRGPKVSKKENAKRIIMIVVCAIGLACIEFG